MINTDKISSSKFYKYVYLKLNSNLDKSDLIGITSVIIYSKDLFPYNKDIKTFLSSIFNEHFPDYIIKSRTLIVAKSTRIINSMTLEDINDFHKKIMTYFDVKTISTEKSNKNSKKSYDKLNTWMNKL